VHVRQVDRERDRERGCRQRQERDRRRPRSAEHRPEAHDRDRDRDHAERVAVMRPGREGPALRHRGQDRDLVEGGELGGDEQRRAGQRQRQERDVPGRRHAAEG